MEPERRARVLTLVATALGSAVAFLDTTVVIVALPHIEADLGLGLSGQQWVYLSYALSLSAFYLVTGAIGDRIGLRRAFVIGVALFALASLLTALAPDESVLLAGRALQGVGGAALTTTSLALLRVTWAGQAGRAIGLWTSLTSVATIGGPAIGGLIVDALSWRWVFLINVPLCAVTIGLAIAGRTSDERPPAQSTLDVVGAGLASLGLLGVSYAIVEVREQGLAAVLLPLGGGLVALAAFVVWTRRASNPVVPKRLLRAHGLKEANIVTVVAYGALGAQLLFLPVYLQFLGFSAWLAGLAFAPPAVALVLLAPRFGAYAGRHGPRLPIAVGMAGIGLGVLGLLPVSSQADAWMWVPLSLAVFAVSLSAVVAPITAAALAPAPPELSGVASGISQTAARVGGILAVAAVGALAGTVFTADGGVGTTPFDPAAIGAVRDAGVSAFRAVAVAIALLAFLASVLAATLLRRPEHERGEA